MAAKVSKAQVEYYELDCSGSKLVAYVYGNHIISVDGDGTVRKFAYNKEFFDGCKAQRRPVKLDVVYSSDKLVIILPDGHAVPIP